MFDEIIAPLVNSEWSRRASWIVMGVLILLLCYTLLGTVSAWHNDFLITKEEKSEQSVIISQNEIKKLIEQIPEQHIFGKYNAVEQAILPITSLQLKLIGVIKTIPEKFSRVIIADGAMTGKVYKIGDKVTSSVKIDSISKEGVVLYNGGHLEKLPLQRARLEFRNLPKSLLPVREGEEG